MKVPIRTQIAAVELIICNRKGHIENLQRLIRDKKRPPEELDIAEQPIPGLEAALRTLKWVEANENRIKNALAGQGGA
jgi:hypothetical protein